MKRIYTNTKIFKGVNPLEKDLPVLCLIHEMKLQGRNITPTTIYKATGKNKAQTERIFEYINNPLCPFGWKQYTYSKYIENETYKTTIYRDAKELIFRKSYHKSYKESNNEVITLSDIAVTFLKNILKIFSTKARSILDTFELKLNRFLAGLSYTAHPLKGTKKIQLGTIFNQIKSSIISAYRKNTDYIANNYEKSRTSFDTSDIKLVSINDPYVAATLAFANL